LPHHTLQQSEVYAANHLPSKSPTAPMSLPFMLLIAFGPTCALPCLLFRSA